MEYLQPQLPRLQAPIVVSHSEVESAARCPFQHQLGYRERWTREFRPDSAAGQGIAWHEVLETHYQTIREVQDGLVAVDRPWWASDESALLELCRQSVQPVIRRFTDISGDLGELLAWMYAGYVAHWGARPNWRILDVERAGHVPLDPPISREFPSLFNPSSDASEDFEFKYRADLLVAENGRILLVDHKSVANFPSQMDLDFDAQVDRYTWALRQEGIDVFGAVFSQARRRMLKRPQTLEERHQQPRTHRTSRELDSIANDMFQVIYAQYAQLMRQEGFAVAPDRAPRDAPRQPSSRHCSFLCDFTEPCLAGRKGNDSRQYLAETGFTQNFTRH